MLLRKRRDDLLSGPLGRRMGCYVGVDDFSPVVRQHHKGQPHSNCGRADGEKVDANSTIN